MNNDKTSIQDEKGDSDHQFEMVCQEYSKVIEVAYEVWAEFERYDIMDHFCL